MGRRVLAQEGKKGKEKKTPKGVTAFSSTEDRGLFLINFGFSVGRPRKTLHPCRMTSQEDADSSLIQLSSSRSHFHSEHQLPILLTFYQRKLPQLHTTKKPSGSFWIFLNRIEATPFGKNLTVPYSLAPKF